MNGGALKKTLPILPVLEVAVCKKEKEATTIYGIL
jgi:hypothetical protein